MTLLPTVILPLSGSNLPANILRSVVLAISLGPIKAILSPG